MSEPADLTLKQKFFEGLSHAACTDNVVTTGGAGGRAGVTVSAMSSVSADTPQPTLLLYDFELGNGLEAEALGELKPSVLLAEGHPLASKPALLIEELVAEPLILLDAPPSRNYLLSLFESCGKEPEVRFHSSSFEMVRGLVGHGLWYSLLATKPASNMTYDGRALVSRPLIDELPSNRVVLARKERNQLSPLAAAAFAAACQDFLQPSACSI